MAFPNILIYLGTCGGIFIRLLNGKFSGIKAVKCERLLWSRPNERSEGCVRGQANQVDLARHVVRGGEPASTTMAETVGGAPPDNIEFLAVSLRRVCGPI